MKRCSTRMKRLMFDFVERRVQFVQHAERAGLHLVDREQERDGRHGLFTAGEQGDALELFAGRAGDDVDAALQHVVFRPSG